MKSARMFSGVGMAILVVAALIIFRGALESGFRGAVTVVRALVDRSFSYEAFLALQIEHRGLLSALRSRNAEFPSSSDHFSYRVAAVFSRYPFNDQQFLTVDAGSEEGIREGMPVLASEHVLIGKVTKVQRTQSEVLTILNPAWKSAVALGSEGVRAVLHGGTPPRLELVPADAVVREEEPVTSISPEFPFNIFVGNIHAVTADAKTLWQSGTLSLPFGSIDRLDRVLIVTNFP